MITMAAKTNLALTATSNLTVSNLTVVVQVPSIPSSPSR